jgi:hypothetical protein
MVVKLHIYLTVDGKTYWYVAVSTRTGPSCLGFMLTMEEHWASINSFTSHQWRGMRLSLHTSTGNPVPHSRGQHYNHRGLAHKCCPCLKYGLMVPRTDRNERIRYPRHRNRTVWSHLGDDR